MIISVTDRAGDEFIVKGYVKISRGILQWEWYKDVNTCKLFLHMLLIANWNDGRSQGVEVPRGSFISSYQNLATETGLSLQNVRTAVKHLKSTHDLTVKQHGKNSVFTVNNYSLYSASNTVTNTQLTGIQHGTNMELTHIKENNNKIIKERENKRARELCGMPDSKRGFSNFEQHSYKFDDLEALILQSQKIQM